MDVRVQSDLFDHGYEINQFSKNAGNAGAIVTFGGVVRDTDDGDLVSMEIEHYPGMTQQALSEIAKQAVDRWDLSNVLVIHRFGSLKPNEPIMMVATASRHRAAAFEAAEFLMDYLKSRAPFWKKEITSNGATWVAARDVDEEALDRW